MAGARIDVKTEPVVDALQRLLAAAGDLKPALKNVGEYEAESTKERIRQGVTPSGAPFAPLNPLYAAHEKKGPGILRGATGDLASIVYQLAGEESVEIGNNIVYGAIHQFGGVIRAKNAPALIFSLGDRKIAVESVTIPARPYLGISAEDEAEILSIIADHLDEAVGGEITQG